MPLNRVTVQQSFDILIVGGGIVGLTSALACSSRGLSVGIVQSRESGAASTAAAGMLAPSIEPAEGAAGHFAFAARDIYRDFIADISDRSGIPIPFEQNGILELAEVDQAVNTVAGAGTLVISPGELRDLEPRLRIRDDLRLLLHSRDGWVDNGQLMLALWNCVRGSDRITTIEGRAERFIFERDAVSIQLSDTSVFRGARTVLAAGAWAPSISGIPTALPIEPVRGQMLAVSGINQVHVILGPTGYSVPRRDRIAFLGSTLERAGFDPATTEEGIAGIRTAVSEISPMLSTAPEKQRWAGLRPMTPDLLPIVGPDPAEPNLIYACGHSRNGILLGPLTGECVAALAAGTEPGYDLGPFTISRFA